MIRRALILLQGAEYLDVIRNDRVWKQVLPAVLKQGGSVASYVLRALAETANKRLAATEFPPTAPAP